MIEWRKSSHSGGVNDQACVELARLAEGIGIRDSKNPAGGHLSLSPARFAALLSRVGHDDLDRPR